MLTTPCVTHSHSGLWWSTFLDLEDFSPEMGSKQNGVSHEPIITDVDYVDTDCKLLKTTNALQTCCAST
jgi:hypothetical protein